MARFQGKNGKTWSNMGIFQAKMDKSGIFSEQKIWQKCTCNAKRRKSAFSKAFQAKMANGGPQVYHSMEAPRVGLLLACRGHSLRTDILLEGGAIAGQQVLKL